MKALFNPVILRMVMAFVVALSAFVVGVLLIRRMRKSMAVEMREPAPRVEREPAFAVAAFQNVIRQLKDKEQDLQRLRQAALDRAAAAETITAAVLTNLDAGVVVFNAAGLAQQANPAARDILGYALVSGMHARDLFRGISALRTECSEELTIAMAEAIERTLLESAVFRNVDADYTSPAGRQHRLAITVAPALGPAGECLGAVCLLTPVFQARTTSPVEASLEAAN